MAYDQGADFIARMDSDDISVAERFEMQVNFFLKNPKVDILGSNILTFSDQMLTASTGKIISYPTLDKLIKFNLLFSCCLAHPTVMFRAATQTSLNYNTTNQTFKAFEDYELWLRLTHQKDAPTFANIGSVLLYHRKHSTNASSGIPVEAEVPMKVQYLSEFYIEGSLRDQLATNPQITEEFIKVTGRQARSDTFSSLKQKRELSQIFEQVSQRFKAEA